MLHSRSRRLARAATAALAIGVSGCGSASDAASVPPTSRDSAGIVIVESAVARWPLAGPDGPFVLDSVPRISIGIESGDDSTDLPYELSRVWDTHRLENGQVVVANSDPQELRIFDATGRYVRTVGRKGGGPGEFGDFSTPYLHAFGDGVLATDNGAFRNHVYDAELGFRETRRFTLTNDIARPFLRGVFADGSLLVLAFEGGGRLGGTPGSVIRSRFSLLRYDSLGAPMDTLGTFAGRERMVNEVKGVINYPYIPLTADPLEAVRGDELLVLRGDAPEIEVRARDGRIVRLLRWPQARVPSADIWPRYKERDLAGIPASDPQSRAQYEAFYARDLPLPEFAPLYRSLKVDAERRIWLERFRLPRDSAARVWDILDADGAWLGAMRTPATFTVHRIGRDYLLGRSLDSLGVERVELYGLRAR